MKINLNENELDSYIKWQNPRLPGKCPYCKRPTQMINHNEEAVVVVDHALWCIHFEMKWA